MRITIDQKLCAGHGRCFSLAPEVFDHDEEGFSVLKVETITPDLEAAAERGAGACPEQAIALDDD
jgi:ferredoxin